MGVAPNQTKIDVNKLAANEEDERYRYLLKNGIVRRVEDEDKVIFAELHIPLDSLEASRPFL